VLGERCSAQITNDGRATHVELLGNWSLRDALGTEHSDLLVARESVRPSFLADDLVSRRAAEPPHIEGRGERGSRLAHCRHGRQPTMPPIQPPFECFTKMTHQMSTVEDLLGLWRTNCRGAHTPSSGHG
jgi:hypothetical protein